MKNPSGRIARWIMRLEMFSPEIIHRKGKDHVVPDALSRAIATIELLGETKDKWYIDLLKKVTDDPQKYAEYRVEENRLFKNCKEKDEFGNLVPKWKLVVPKDQVKCVLENCHDNFAHLGYHKSLSRVRFEHYWPKLEKDVRRYVNECDRCKENKVSNKITRPPAGKQKEADFPWQMVSIDYEGPFPRSRNGNTMILVIVDWFSKFVIAEPMRAANANTLVKFLEKEVFLTFGVPSVCLTDNGVQFKSQMFQALLAKYKVTHHKTPFYSPQSNNAERVNRVLLDSMRCYTSPDQRNWDECLPLIRCAINSAKHEATKHSPYYINFGREMQTTASEKHEILSKEKPLTDRIKSLEKIREIVAENIKKAYETNTRQYNLRTRAKETIFEPNDIVWRRNFQLSDATKGISKKLMPRFIKCRILSRNGHVYETEDVQGKYRGTFDAQHLMKK